MNFEDAIYKLYPQTVRTVERNAFDASGNIVIYDETAVQALVNANAYIAKRVAEYPTIGDQLDALWKGGDAQTEMLAKVMAVKAKYPKEQA